MSKRSIIAASIIALAAPIAASGETSIEGAVTLGYSFGSISSGGTDVDVNALSLRMDSTVTFSENFEMGLKIGAHGYDIDGANVDLTLGNFALAPRYTLNNGLILGAYYEMAKSSISNAPVNPDFSSYGLSLGKDFDTWDIEGFIGVSDSNLFSFIGTDVDIMDVGVRSTYDGIENLTLGGHFIYTEADIAAAGNSISLYSLGLGADYLINDNWSVYGGLSRTWADESWAPVDASATRGSVGVAYTFGSTGPVMPMVASLELVTTDLSLDQPGSFSADYDEIRLGLTIPLGHKGRSLPLNSTTHTNINGGHSAVSTLLGVY